jgi:hypothetical protein
MRRQQLVKRPTGLAIPRGGHNYDLLAWLLSPLVVVRNGKRTVLRTTREQIARYWYLIEEDSAQFYTK